MEMESATEKMREQVQGCPPPLLRENTTPSWPVSEAGRAGRGGAGGGSCGDSLRRKT